MNHEESERPDAPLWLRWNVARRHADPAKREKHPRISLNRNAGTLREVYPEPLRLRSGPFAWEGANLPAPVIPAALTTLAMQAGAAELFCGPALPSLTPGNATGHLNRLI